MSIPQEVAQNDASTHEAPSQGSETTGFAVSLENFSGPFEVLLNLIGKHELDITEVALAAVTDEFIAYIQQLQQKPEVGPALIDEASEFLVVAATLLDLKAARLLPQGEVEDDEDIALLEARDLLFARLLQYRAFKEAAKAMGQVLEGQEDRIARSTGPDPEFASLLPEVQWRHSLDEFAQIAVRALTPRLPDPSDVGLSHLHAAPVSVSEQVEVLSIRLKSGKPLSFRALVNDAQSLGVVVARFLALLDMFRAGSLAFDQLGPLAELTVHWVDREVESAGMEEIHD